MNELSDELKRHFALQGGAMAATTAIAALIQILSPEQKRAFLAAHAVQVEAAQTSCLPTVLPEVFFETFEEESQRLREEALEP